MRGRKDEWKEYTDGRDNDECASYQVFCDVAHNATELRHIKHARKCLNFQHCKICVKLNGVQWYLKCPYTAHTDMLLTRSVVCL